MEMTEGLRLLNRFEIAPGDGADAADVRMLLARFLSNGSIALSDLQTVRDVVRRKGVQDPWAYGFIAVMFLSLRGGNAFLAPERIVRLVEAAGVVEGEPAEAAEAFKSGIDACKRLMLAAAEKLAGDVIVKNGERWFFQKNLKAVQSICEAIGRRKAPLADAGFAAVELSAEELADAVSFVNRRTNERYSLNEEQRAAVAKVAARRLTVVIGGPGTGKTTVVCSFLRALLAKRAIDPADVALAAPTARAGQRMGEAIRKQCGDFGDEVDPVRCQIESLNGQTVHSLLGGYPPNWKYNAGNRLPHKFVIVDESSMVDVSLMQALLSALDDGCRLVLLGDGDQLPSVDAGAVLGDLVENVGGEVVVRLTKSNRFTGKLAACAMAINDKAKGLTEEMRWTNFREATTEMRFVPGESWTTPLLREETENTCFVATVPKDFPLKERESLLVKWAEDFGLLGGGGDSGALKLAREFPAGDASLTKGENTPASQALFDALERSRILAIVREGPHGVKGINELLVRKRHGGRLPINPCLQVGVPVMVMRNTRARNLFNGDIGITIAGKNGMVALFPRGTRTVACPVALLPEHEPAYAITVHKSQGSEFENVLVVLPDDEKHPLLNRQIVYTGITRAKKRAVILGTDDALKAALMRKLERDAGIG